MTRLTILSGPWVASFALACVSFLPTASLAEPEDLDGIAAIVDDGVVLRSELQARIDNVKENLQGSGVRLPPESVLQDQVLDQLILESVQEQEAARIGIHVSDEQLQQAMESIARNNGLSLEQFRTTLAREGVDYETTRESIRRDITFRRFQGQRLGNQVRITTSDVQRFLQSGGADSLAPEYSIRHILISGDATPEGLAESRRIVTELRERIVSGASFADLAVARSKGPNALTGGLLEWRKSAQLPEAFRVVNDMAVGEVSAVLQSPAGYHLIKLEDKRGRSVQFSDEVRVSRIVLSPNELRDAPKTLALARETHQRLDAGAEFGELAYAHSDDPESNLRRGELGWIVPQQLPPEVQEAVATLDEGEYSRPIRTPTGWHIVLLHEKRVADRSSEALENYALQVLHDQRLNELMPGFLRTLRSEAYVEKRL